MLVWGLSTWHVAFMFLRQPGGVETKICNFPPYFQGIHAWRVITFVLLLRVASLYLLLHVWWCPSSFLVFKYKRSISIISYLVLIVEMLYNKIRQRTTFGFCPWTIKTRKNLPLEKLLEICIVVLNRIYISI